MKNGWSAFWLGLSQALHHRWMLVILFAANLLSALPLAVLPAAGLAAGLGHRPVIHQAADGVDAWLVIEALTAPTADAVLGQSAETSFSRLLRQATQVGLATAAALPLLAWLTGAFLGGGVLLTCAEAHRPKTAEGQPSEELGTGSAEQFRTVPSRWRRFLWGCYHWWGAFLLLGAVQGVASVVLFVPLLSAAIAASVLLGGWFTWVVVPLLALAAMLWLAVAECTRVVAVVDRTRNVARAFGRAVRFVFRHLPAVAGLYGLALALLGAVHALFRWALMPRLPLDWWPLVLVVQQTFILVRLGARLARLAGTVALVHTSMRAIDG